jgi:hypothetical protein
MAPVATGRDEGVNAGNAGMKLLKQMPFPCAIVLARVIIAAAPLGGCALSVTAPVTVAPKNGEEPLRGIVTATPGGGKFGIANSKIQCSGEYPFTPGQITVSITTTCSDGRTGSGTAVRTGTAGGSGTMRMSDGTEALFAYGPEALALRASLAPAPAAPRESPVAPPFPPSSPSPAAKAATPHLDDEQRRFGECGTKAVVVLDDGISSADAVAEAVIRACRPELDDICMALERRNNAAGFCTSAQLAEGARQMRPIVAGRILEFRAKRRILGDDRRDRPRQPRTQTLEQ